MSDDFVETKLLEIVEPTEEDYEDLYAYACHGCGADMSSSTDAAPIFIWAEPLGSNPEVACTVAVRVYHSRYCALTDIDIWTKKIQRDVMVVHRVR